jgi:hypothetical protein
MIAWLSQTVWLFYGDQSVRVVDRLDSCYMFLIQSLLKPLLVCGLTR